MRKARRKAGFAEVNGSAGLRFSTFLCGSWVLLIWGCGGVEIGGRRALPSVLEIPYAHNRPAPSHVLLFLGADAFGRTWLFTAGAKGEDPAFLLKEPVAPLAPRWAPLGGRIAYFSSFRYAARGLFVLSAGGGMPLRISLGVGQEGAGEVDWSSDGKELAYVGADPPTFEVYRVDVESGRLGRVTRTPVYRTVETPRYLGGGRNLVAVLREGERADLVRIFAKDAALLTSAGSGQWYGNPRPSPDGRRVLAETNRWGNCEIALLDAETGAEERFTWSGAAGESREPRWSPDGASVVFASNRERGWAVFRADASGRNTYRLSPPWLSARQPVFSADSRKVVFVGTDGEGRTELYGVDAGGGNPEPLTANRLVESHPELRGAKW